MFFCVDGLNGFREAINAAFPHSQIQRCIIHQIRSSTKYVSYKDIKVVMADLKKIYQAINEDEAKNSLIQFKENWAKTYPSCVRSWEENLSICPIHGQCLIGFLLHKIFCSTINKFTAPYHSAYATANIGPQSYAFFAWIYF